MGLMPGVRGKNALAAFAGNGAESISAVLSEMQKRKRHQRKKIYY